MNEKNVFVCDEEHCPLDFLKKEEMQERLKHALIFVGNDVVEELEKTCHHCTSEGEFVFSTDAPHFRVIRMVKWDMLKNYKVLTKVTFNGGVAFEHDSNVDPEEVIFLKMKEEE